MKTNQLTRSYRTLLVGTYVVIKDYANKYYWEYIAIVTDDD